MNRSIGGYADDETPSEDYLWPLVYDCGTSYYENSDYNNMKFSDFYNYLFDLIQGSGSYGLLSSKMLTEIAADYWIAPIRVKTEKKGNHIRISWKVGGKTQGLETFCQTALTFYSEEGIQMVSEPIPYSYESNDKNPYVKFYADIYTSMLYHVSSSTMKVGISFFPHYYSWHETDEQFENRKKSCIDKGEEIAQYEPINGYTGPYSRIFWEGQASQLSLSSLADITLDTDW